MVSLSEFVDETIKGIDAGINKNYSSGLGYRLVKRKGDADVGIEFDVPLIARAQEGVTNVYVPTCNFSAEMITRVKFMVTKV